MQHAPRLIYACLDRDSGDFATSSEPLASTEVGTSATPVAKSSPGPSASGPVQLDNVKNIRDLCTVRDANIKPGRVYRTGYLSKASKADVSGFFSIITRKEHLQTIQTKKMWGGWLMKGANICAAWLTD